MLDSVRVHQQDQALINQDCKLAVSCLDVISHVPILTLHGQPQKKGLSPGQYLKRIKLVKGVSCVSQCLSASVVPNVPNVATDVRGRLKKFWQVWQDLGANPRVLSILKEGYSLPFRDRPPFNRFPLIVSKEANPLKNKCLTETLTSYIQKTSCRKSGCQVFPSLFTTVSF